MEIKFPEQQDPFPKTLVQAVISCLVALAIGLFLGNGLSALFGTDESVINTSTYTDRMAAIRTLFTDRDQLDSYSRTALALQDMEGLRLLTSRDRDYVMALRDGGQTDAFSLFDQNIQRSLTEMMHTEDALYGVESAAGTPIEDVWLRNAAVSGGVVYFYLYYDEAGFAGLAFDPGGENLFGTDQALPLTKTSGTDGQYEWFVIYDMGD